MEKLVDFLKGFLGAVVASAAVGMVAGLALRWTGGLGLLVTAAYLIGYVMVMVRVFGTGRTWVGFGLLVALLLALPAFTVACFASVEGDVLTI